MSRTRTILKLPHKHSTHKFEFLLIRFAQLQVKYGIAKLLSEYDLTLNAKMKSPVKLVKASLTMEIEDGIWVDFKKRSK